MRMFASVRGGMVILLFILAAILIVPMSCTLAQSQDKPSHILRTTPAPGQCTMFCPTPENGE
jgi:hypothetical protein